MRQLASSRRSTAALTALTALFALCAVQDTLHPSAALGNFLNTWVYDDLVLAAGIICCARGIAVGKERLPWILFGAALLSWGVGDTIWTFADNPPFPYYSDIGYLAVYPFAYAALLLLLRERVKNIRKSLWLDGLIGGLAVAAAGTAVVFGAVLKATNGSPEAVATNLAYPLADLMLIALVVWSLAVTGWRVDRTWGLITLGLLVFSVSDCLYLYQTSVGTYVNGGPTDIGWLGGGALIAWAAWQPRSESSKRAVEGWSLLVAPVGFGMLALGVLAYDHGKRQVTPLALGLAIAAVLAVIARMGMTFAENMQMIASSRHEARTDALTGLNNRRCLLDDLETAIADEPDELMLALFDLNGFKHYNDTFGHPAGDALLARLGTNLARFITGRGSAYRLGGDEFCILMRLDGESSAIAVENAARSLAEQGDAFAVSAAYGQMIVGVEAKTTSDSLSLADRRLYANKERSRASAVEQSSHVLLQALAERNPKLSDHVTGVAELAEATAIKLGLPYAEIGRVRLAAALHDIGKMAIPDAILEKPTRLTAEEWEFLRRHTLIGERILLAAPALSQIAPLVRASHERFDGDGYPDGLAAGEIPLASRIVFVCDAFDAMTSPRAYANEITIEAALDELTRNSGTQFDPEVVRAFAEVVAAQGAPRRIALAS
jgi:two-component system, cell cycle response regulator